MQHSPRPFLTRSSDKNVETLDTKDNKPKVSRELAWSGFEEGSKALMPGIESGFSQGFSLKKNEEPKKDEPQKDPVPQQNEGKEPRERERPKFTFGSTLGLYKAAKEKGQRRGVKALFKKGEWTKLLEAQKKYEKDLAKAIDKGRSDPSVLKPLAKKCGSLVESCESYIQDKSELLEGEEQKQEVRNFEKLKKELIEKRKSAQTEEKKTINAQLSQMEVDGPGFADPVSEQRRTMAMAMLPRLKVELLQLSSGQLPSKGLNDSTLVKGESGPIGSGLMNAPTLNKFEEGDGQVEGVFKQDMGLEVSRNTQSKKVAYTSSHEMSERAVGSSMVDRLLGTNVVAQTDFGIVGGKLGQVMEKGEGVTPTTKGTKQTPKHANKDIDYTDPELQRQLYALEWVDFFTGEGDRHGQNLMVKQGKGGTKVTGIDNDMGFTTPEQGVSQGGKEPSKFPQWIDAKLAQRIMANDFTLNNYVKMLEPILPARSLEVAKARFPKVKEHAEKLVKEGKVINEKGANVLDEKNHTMEWGSKELESAMENDQSSGLLAGFWKAQKGKTQAN